MRVAFVVSPRAEHQDTAATALAAGIRRCGDQAELYSSGQGIEVLRSRPDAIACWGWRNGQIFRSRGANVLVMERAYLADRFTWVSLGWNGLNGRAQWPACPDDGQRWRKYFANLMKPWRSLSDSYALLLGQVPTDQACINVDHEHWLATTAKRLREMSYPVLFRAHPKGSVRGVPGTASLGGTLEQALADAAFAVTWNSNSGVDAIMAGVPTVAMDAGSMVYEVASHTLEPPIVTPDRERWGRSLAWRQWLPQELADGSAWRTVKSVLA